MILFCCLLWLLLLLLIVVRCFIVFDAVDSGRDALLFLLLFAVFIGDICVVQFIDVGVWVHVFHGVVVCCFFLLDFF